MELHIEGLSKRYPNGTQALQKVSLNIPQGMFGLLGPNGAGKSTLMRTLATLQEADSGKASLDGIDVLKQKDAVRKSLGYLPQEFGLYPKVSAEDLLSHFAALKGIADAKERRDTVAALLRQTNLYDYRRKSLGSYSGGMKQRFGIAQALLGNPRLIIVDEPTAGLDPPARARAGTKRGETPISSRAGAGIHPLQQGWAGDVRVAGLHRRRGGESGTRRFHEGLRFQGTAVPDVAGPDGGVEKGDDAGIPVSLREYNYL
jgi:ABC-type Na+ transport system ATPase subunit NatA